MDSLYRRWAEVRKPSKSDHSGVDSDGYYFVDDEESGQRVFVSHPRRLAYYKKGILARLKNLAGEYCVMDLTFRPSDQVVDVGAHSGEFGLWVDQFGVSYLGIEPDPVAFGALVRNLPDSTLEPVAIGAQAGRARFSLATSTGDSSLEVGSGKSITVQVKTLDEVVGKVFPSGPIAPENRGRGFRTGGSAGWCQNLGKDRIGHGRRGRGEVGTIDRTSLRQLFAGFWISASEGFPAEGYFSLQLGALHRISGAPG